MIPSKYKEKNASLFDLDDCDYMLPDLVNYVLDSTEEGIADHVNHLSDNQCRLALCIYIYHYRKLRKDLEKIKDVIEYA